MTLTLLNEWVELQDIDCPPHLRAKRLIDRLGRRTSRCVTPEEAEEEQETFELPTIWPHVNRKFTAEMKGVFNPPPGRASGHPGPPSEEVGVTSKFLEIFGDSSIEWTKPPSASHYIPPSGDIAPYIEQLTGSTLQEDTPTNRELARQLWSYYGEDKNEMEGLRHLGQDRRNKILLWAKRNRPEGLDPDKTEKNPLDEINDSLQASVSTLGYEEIWGDIIEYESANLGDKSFYQSSIMGLLSNWKGNSIYSKQAQVFQEAVSYLLSGRKDRFFEEYKELAKIKGEWGGEKIPIFNPHLDYDAFDEKGKEILLRGGGAFSDETLEYQAEAVKVMIAKERELWKSLIGDKSIRVYRGVTILDKDKVPEIGSTQSHDFPLSSWSISPSMAAGFGHTVLARTITADDIISSFFSMAGSNKRREVDEGTLLPTAFRQGGVIEGEVILYTPEEGSEVDVILALQRDD